MKKVYNTITSKNGWMFLFSVMILLATTSISKAQVSCYASFTYSVNGQVVNFNDTSWANGGTVTSWAWSFGDGSTGTGQSLVHTYIGTGPFYACLTITTSLGCTDSMCQMVYLSPCNLSAVAMGDSAQQYAWVVATGGTSPYTYLWTTGSNQQTITTPNSGIYCCVSNEPKKAKWLFTSC